MALELTQLNAATEDLWNNTDPIDIKFTDNVLLWMLLKQSSKENFDDYFVKASETVDGGKKIRVPLEYDEANSGDYGQNTVITQAKKDIINAARFGWGGVFASNGLGLDDQVQNSGDRAMVALADQYIQNVLKTAWKKLASQVMTNSDTYGVDALIDDLFNTTTSTAYGSIAEDDMALWAANVYDTADVIDFECLQLLWRTPAIGQHRGKRPNLGITTEALKDAYERSLQTQQRFSDQKMVEAGFDNILHKGAPICADDNMSASRFMALNTNFLKLKAHKKYNFTKPKWVAKEESGQPDKININTRWVGQLVCSHRKAHIYANNLSES